MANAKSVERLKRKRNEDAQRILQLAYEKAADKVQTLALRAVEVLAEGMEEAPEWRDRLAAAKELTRLAGLRPPEQVEVTHYARLSLDQLRVEALATLARIDASRQGNAVRRDGGPSGVAGRLVEASGVEVGPVGGVGPIQTHTSPLGTPPSTEKGSTEAPEKNLDPPKYRPRIVADYEGSE